MTSLPSAAAPLRRARAGTSTGDRVATTSRSASSTGARQTSFADQTALIDTTFVVLDLETTGLSPDRDRITEVGAVRARGGEVLAELRTFVRPGVPIPAAVTAITGITDADVADAPDITTVLPTIVDFLGGAVFVAHNARFDLGFLRAGAQRLGMPPLRPRVIDTAVLARRLMRDEVRDVRLGTLARHLRVPDAPDHRALNDARATLHVLHALIERATAYGATSIEDLEQLCGPTGDRSHRRIALIADAPSAPGVYRFLADDGTVLYVGKASDLRRRLRSYFGQDTRRRTADLVAATARVTWTVVPTEIEAAVREVRELQASRPRYNHRSTRPDPGATVTLTREPFPRLAIVRGGPVGDADGLGPVPRAVAERVVTAIESVIALRPCRMRLRRTQDEPACMLKDLHRCDAVCDGTQTPDAYAAVVEQARDAMRDPTRLLGTLHARMQALAAEGAFEQAAERREDLVALVRAFDARTHHDLTHASDLVLERRLQQHDGSAVRTHVEVVEVRRGRLVATASGPEGAVDAGAGRLDPASSPAPVPDPGPREEADLLRRWLAADDVLVRHVEGVFASPVAGGAVLATIRGELRTAERANRGDEVVLTRAKVRRRASDARPSSASAS
jgi:DNA polymerase III subunit epsilon